MVEIVERLSCPRCGAPLELEAGEIIVTCAYCGSDTRLSGSAPFVLKHSLLPARVDAAGLEDHVRGWMARAFYAPRDLSKRARMLESLCRYFPFFVFHVEAKARYSGVLLRTGPRLPRSGELVRTLFWKVLARRAAAFPTREFKIPLDTKIPFEGAKLLPGAKFLNAEMDEDEAERLAKDELADYLRDLLKNEVDDLTEFTPAITIRTGEFLHAPVWHVRYAYHGAEYTLLLDAASGEPITAEMPPPSGGFRDLLGGTG